MKACVGKSLSNSFLVLFLILTLCGLALQVNAETLQFNATLPTAGSAANDRVVPAPPSIDADSYILVDATTGKVITEKNAHNQVPPASLTKMMSMYVISHALRTGQIQLDDMVRVSSKAHAMDGSKMFIKEGQQVSVKDLVQGVVVDSGNDATVALAEYIAGSEESFVDLMNQEAERLGMNDSHFADSTGMPSENHYTTALDMAILSAALINHFPEYYAWYSQKWFSFNDIKQSNRNRLLWRYKFADGIKTGHTKEAGYCLAASAQNDNTRLISVVMGAPTDAIRTEGTQRLFTYGFRFFKTYSLYKKGETITQPKIWKGKQRTIPLGITENITLTIPRGQYKNLKVKTSLEDPLTAPVAKGQKIGTLSITLGDETLSETPLVALQAVDEGGLWTRIKDSVSMSFDGMMDSDDEFVG